MNTAEPAANIPALGRDIARLADAVGSLSPRRNSRAPEIAKCKVDIFGCSVAELAALINHPDSQRVVTAKCNHCDTMLETIAINAPFVACDPCRSKAQKAEANERHRKYWEHICPERYRETDLNHPDFPKAVWDDVKKAYDENPGQSFFLFGPSGQCKTRVGMLILKRALIRHNKRVNVLWPEKLKTIAGGWENSAFDTYAAHDLLLLDDSLLTACREPKLIDALKQLIDVRMRHNRAIIVTSQIGEEGVKSGKEYGDAKQADLERIDALVRRLREVCKVIPFVKAEANAQAGGF